MDRLTGSTSDFEVLVAFRLYHITFALEIIVKEKSAVWK